MNEPEVQQQLVKQFLGALAMLRQAIERCPDELWRDAGHKNAYWRLAYHALFYTHLYVHATEQDFVPWAKHQTDANFLDSRPDAPGKPLPPVEPYTREAMLEYYAQVCDAVRTWVPRVRLDAPSGFFWLPFQRLETHFYNLRHVEHHVGQLADRLRNGAGLHVDWVRAAE
jgi:hypothetical protein